MDLRAKINDLEKNLAQKRKEIKDLNDRIISATTDVEFGLNKVEKRNKEFEIRDKALNDKIKFLEKTILNRDKEIGILKIDIEQRNKQINNLKKLEIQFLEKDKDIAHLKKIIEQMNKQKEIDKKDFLQQLLNKDLEIEKTNEILKKIKRQLETNENLIHKKDLEIQKLENEFEAKTKQINEITNNFKVLELKISDEIQLSSKLIKKIDKLMHLKGFISDKEFEHLKEKIEKDQLQLNY
ncbi:MAG: hypothetical protein ACFFDK_00050 [Promethearchaeota archaeon]